jgi:hypothetical protein
LADADSTPYILELGPFDQSKEGLKGKRWENFVTVMSFDQATKKWVDRSESKNEADCVRLDYATSYYDGEDGITVQGVNIDDLDIVNVIYLSAHDTFKGERSPLHTPSSGPQPAPVETTGAAVSG